jgi:hypothetical protein
MARPLTFKQSLLLLLVMVLLLLLLVRLLTHRWALQPKPRRPAKKK